mmetsp:Transcript_4038/g.6728  ORF Transcript_4038/g.6728 Transcript_4038/m.6728 type:complete len:201 (+) Transcript_4038:153-755(+)
MRTPWKPSRWRRVLEKKPATSNGKPKSSKKSRPMRRLEATWGRTKPSRSERVPSTRASGRTACGMVWGIRPGPMAPPTAVSGWQIEPKALESFFIAMEISTLGNGPETWPTASGSTTTREAQLMLANGRRTCRMALALRRGSRERNTRAVSRTGKNKVTASIAGQMAPFMKEPGGTMSSMVQVATWPMMAVPSRVSGRTR